MIPILEPAHCKSRMSNIVRNEFSYGYKNKILVTIFGSYREFESELY